MDLSLHSMIHQCLTLFPALFLQSLYVPLTFTCNSCTITVYYFTCHPILSLYTPVVPCVYVTITKSYIVHHVQPRSLPNDTKSGIVWEVEPGNEATQCMHAYVNCYNQFKSLWHCVKSKIS